MNAKGAMGWVILAVALAVPAFMFWNWWSMLNSKGPEAGRKPPPGPVFNQTKMASGLPNPVAGAPATVPAAAVAPASAPALAGAPPVGLAAPVPPSPADAPPGATSPATAEASALPVAAPAQAEPAPSAAGPAPAAAPSGEPPLAYNPTNGRDPMISPMDIKRLAQKKLEEEWARSRLKEEALKVQEVRRPPKKPKEPPIETRVTLQGISLAQGSIAAIVNDEIVHEGQVLEPLKVRVVRITNSTVTFEYKRKTFTKSISQ